MTAPPRPPPRRRARALAALGLAAWWWPSAALAQKIDLVSMSGQYMPGVDMVDPAGKVQVASYDFAANVPVPLGPKTFLIPGLGYHTDAVSFADTPPDFIDLKAFHSAELSTMLVQLLPNDWSVAGRVAPGLAGDFQGVDGRMLRFNALAMASHSFSPRFVLGGGGILTFAFGSLLPLPALYFDARPFDGFQIEGFVPAFLQARYTIAGRVRLGVSADFSGNEYAVRDDRIRSRWPCAPAAVDDPSTPADETSARPDQCFDNLAYSVGTAGLTAGVRLVSTVWLTGLFGHSFYRRFDQRNEDRDLLPGGRQDLPNVVVVRAGISWRLPPGD